MKTEMFSIFDSKSGLYNRPFHMINQQLAHRACLDLVTDRSTDIAKHPEDFVLFHVGSYEDTTGKFEQLPALVPLFRFNEIQVPIYDKFSNQPEVI